MNKYLVSTCEVYRVDTEAEAKQLIEEAKKAREYQLVKYISEYKERKAKGEVIDSYFKVSLTKAFNDIKEPEASIDIEYKREAGYFPTNEEDNENEF
jgi:putative IMPACT (imprinted ancient) family translation regulator